MARLPLGKIQVALPRFRMLALLHQGLGSEKQGRSGLRMIGILLKKRVNSSAANCQRPPE